MLKNYTEDEWMLIDVEEMCIRLNISDTTAYKLLNSGEIKGFRTYDGRGPWKIPVIAINSYIQKKSGIILPT